jgi:acetyl-CoA carboxylase carboxyl transferase subunit alpha
LDNHSFYLPHEKQIQEYRKTIEHLKKQNQESELFSVEIKELEQKLRQKQEEINKKLNSWDRVLISRHPNRPHSSDYLKNITERFYELHGDRTFSDDTSVIGGFVTIDGIKCMCIGQEKGGDTESRVYRNFGMVSPEGFRKALRFMKLAEKYSLPIVVFIDTPGAYAGLEAEQRGQGWAIANNLLEMSQIHTPIIVVIIGEASSGGALGMAVGDVVGMMEHAYYSVISPEGCASIIWKDFAKKQEAAEALKLNAEHLLDLGIIDEIIPEALGGAHHDHLFAYDKVKSFIVEKYHTLKRVKLPLLLEQRYEKFRNMGQFVEK